MNWLDFALALLVGLSVLSGLLKGFARVVVGFFAAVFAAFCGFWFYGTAGYYLLPYVSHKGVANFLGFLAVFIAVVLLGALAGKILSVIFKWAGLSWLDRLLGAGFGIIRGLVFAVVLVLALMAFSPAKPPHAIVESRFAPYVIEAASIGAAMMPHEVKEGVRESYEKVKEAWSDLLKKGQNRQ